MSIKSSQLNNNRLSGNRLFLYSFKNFSTTSTKKSLRIYIIRALSTIVILLGIVYILLVVAIIFNIMNKKEGLAIINDVSIKTAKIEREYNSLISTLTKDFALENGFVKAADNNFAFRKDTATGFSFLYEELESSEEQ